MGARGLDPATVARTSAAARSGRSAIERLVVRVPSLFAPLAGLVLRMPRGRLRAALLRYVLRRAYAAFNRRDWELNTLAMDRERYELVNSDPTRDMIGMNEGAKDVAGYVAVQEGWHDGWDVVRVGLAPGTEVLDAGPGRLLTIDRWQAHLERTGMTLDLVMATLYEIEHGLVVRQTVYWDVDRALAKHGLAP